MNVLRGMTLLELLAAISIGLPILAFLTGESVRLMRLTRAQELSFTERTATQRVRLELAAAAAWIDAHNLPGTFKIHPAGNISRASGQSLLQNNPSPLTKPGDGTALSYARTLRAPLLKIASCNDAGQLLTGTVDLLGTATVQADAYRSAFLLSAEKAIEGSITLHGSGPTRSFAWQACDGLFYPVSDPSCSAGYLILLDSSITLYASKEAKALRLLASQCDTVLENQPIADNIASINFTGENDLQGIFTLAATGVTVSKQTFTAERRLSLPHRSHLLFVSLLP